MVEVSTFTDRAGALHDLAMPVDGDARIWVLRPTRRAVVLGSSQRRSAVDTERLSAAHVDLATRRSGGGAVWIEPDAVVWIDALVPRGSPLWSDDLAKTFVGVGRLWQRALATTGVDTDLVDQRTVAADSALARWACWAGLGWGELTLRGTKVVGLSQRRTRWGARVQGMAVIDESASQVVDWFAADPDGALGAPDPADLRAAIGVASLDVDREALEAAVVAALADAID